MDLEKAITTQEQLDAVISGRLERERSTIEKKYSDYEDLKNANAGFQEEIAGLKKSLEDGKAAHEKEIEGLNSKIRGYEISSAKMKIAHEYGIPLEMAERLGGDDEEAIREDAEAFSKFMKPGGHQATPPRSTEPAGVGGTREALKRTLENLNQED